MMLITKQKLKNQIQKKIMNQFFLKTDDFTKNDLNVILDKALKHTSLNTVDKIYYDIATIKDDGINARAKIAEAYFAHDFDVVVRCV